MVFQPGQSGNPDRKFPPGVSGNPNGRPKGRSLTARLRDLLDQYELNGKRLPAGKQVADLVVEGLVLGAAKGNSRNLQEVFNRVDGKLTERVEINASLSIEAHLARLSNQELDVYEQLTRKLVGDDAAGD
jgi:hypothetical protein